MSGTCFIRNKKTILRYSGNFRDEEIMRYQQHINGDWLSLKNQLKIKYPSLTDFDVDINEKLADQILILADKLKMTRQQFIWMLNKL